VGVQGEEGLVFSPVQVPASSQVSVAPPPDSPASLPAEPSMAEVEERREESELYWREAEKAVHVESTGSAGSPQVLGLDWKVHVEPEAWPALETFPPSPPQPPAAESDESAETEFVIAGAQSFPAIVVYQGGKVRGRYEMRGDLFLIGRVSAHRPEVPHLDFGAYTDGKRVSRHHASIFQREGQYFIEDVGSEHGTWLNGQFLQPNVAYPLSDDDTISIAGVADLELEMSSHETF
jgi:pSer/pThr/pTyr-binding forkhead associated (FHA) protein